MTEEQRRLGRRGFCGLMGGAAAVVGGVGGVGLGAGSAAAAPSDGGTGSRWVRRAEATWEALQRWFATHDGSDLYREQYPVAAGDNAYSYEWPFSQAHAAALDLTGIPAVGRRYRAELDRHDRAQQHYWSAKGSTGLPGFASYPTAPWGGGGDFFYDDNEWVGLIDLQRYLRFGDRSVVAQAEQIFDLVVSGWDDDASHAAPGGVFWTQASWSQDRNTVSNMPGALVGLSLYQLDRNRRRFDWSMRMYDWTNQHLVDPKDGLYWDHLSLDGELEKTKWSYNQGVPVGVNVLLHRITGRRHYLDEAVRIADAATSFYGTDALDRQPVFFNSIWFRNLLLLQSVTGGSERRRQLESYAERLWTDKRDPDTGLFHFADDGSTQMIEQAGTTQVFALAALPPSAYGTLL